MPTAASSYTISDGADTPVVRTFTVLDASPLLTVMREILPNVPARKQNELTLSTPVSSLNAKFRKGEFRVNVPTVLADGTIYYNRARVVYDVYNEAPQSDINNLHAFVKNGLAQSAIQGAMRDNLALR